eukprot:12984015-Alexandrium_andersonii.AAC.1
MRCEGRAAVGRRLADCGSENSTTQLTDWAPLAKLHRPGFNTLLKWATVLVKKHTRFTTR